MNLFSVMNLQVSEGYEGLFQSCIWFSKFILLNQNSYRKLFNTLLTALNFIVIFWWIFYISGMHHLPFYISGMHHLPFYISGMHHLSFYISGMHPLSFYISGMHHLSFYISGMHHLPFYISGMHHLPFYISGMHHLPFYISGMHHLPFPIAISKRNDNFVPTELILTQSKPSKISFL